MAKTGTIHDYFTAIAPVRSFAPAPTMTLAPVSPAPGTAAERVLAPDFECDWHALEGEGIALQATLVTQTPWGSSAFEDIVLDSNADVMCGELGKVDADGLYWRRDCREIVVDVTSGDGFLTPAFVRYAELVCELRDYPILDESHWSDRQADWCSEHAGDWADEAAELLDRGWDAVEYELQTYSPDIDDLRTLSRDEAIAQIGAYIAQQYLDNN